MRNLTGTFKKLLGSNLMRRTRAARNCRESRLSVERLEDRSMLSVVSWWTADNTAADSVGSNNATLVGGATYAPGQIGQAFSFDGVDDRVQLADSPSLQLTGSMTIEGWVKATSLPAQHGMIFFRGDDRGGLDPYWLSVEPDGNVQFMVEDGAAAASVSSHMPLGQFVHLAGTLDDATGEMRLYLNSVLVSHTITDVRPFGDLDPASNPGVGIGNHGGYPATPHNFPFHGLIDELKIYDQALTGDEVAAIFNAGKGSLQPEISVSDATLAEGDSSVRYLGNLVSPQEGGLVDPWAMIHGPDGNLYVSTRMQNSILRYSPNGSPLPAPGKSGAEFVSPGDGGLNQARGIAFGPDGNLYVVSTGTNSVLRFDAASGAPLGALVASGSGGLDAPRGLLFQNGYLYVTSVGGTSPASGMDSVLRFDATTGAPAGVSGLPGDAVFIASGSGGLDNPSMIVFHGGGFYVSSTNPATSNSVLRFGANGAFMGAFVSTGSGGLSGPTDLVFRDGYLYVSSNANNKVLRYDGTTGAFVNEVASGGGLARPIGLLFESDGDLLVASGDSDEIRRYGVSSEMVFTVNLSAPFPTPVSVGFSTADGTARVADGDYVTAAGSLTFQPGQSSKTVLVQVVDDAVGEPAETFSVELSGASGGVITDGQGVGTIFDNDTKFYVVNDASPDRTYEYDATGTAAENYALNSGNTAPRGAASTAAGTTVWVVDANKNVYLYNASGALQGSWAAGGLANNAQVEGIATNGTDVWIVDAKSDKVFKYAGAATRTSGSQSAASSFALNSGNTGPKDIVTDGTSLWVVNDSTTDKVFKYTLSGSLLGSWTIGSANSQPTGLTLDPSSPSTIWIVDAGADKVFQYNNAAGLTSGSRTPDASWSLAAGNTNPQGIADPPISGGHAAATGGPNAVDAYFAWLGREDTPSAVKRGRSR